MVLCGESPLKRCLGARRQGFHFLNVRRADFYPEVKVIKGCRVGIILGQARGHLPHESGATPRPLPPYQTLAWSLGMFVIALWDAVSRMRGSDHPLVRDYWMHVALADAGSIIIAVRTILRWSL